MSLVSSIHSGSLVGDASAYRRAPKITFVIPATLPRTVEHLEQQQAMKQKLSKMIKEVQGGEPSVADKINGNNMVNEESRGGSGKVHKTLKEKDRNSGGGSGNTNYSMSSSKAHAIFGTPIVTDAMDSPQACSTGSTSSGSSNNTSTEQSPLSGQTRLLMPSNLPSSLEDMQRQGVSNTGNRGTSGHTGGHSAKNFNLKDSKDVSKLNFNHSMGLQLKPIMEFGVEVDMGDTGSTDVAGTSLTSTSSRRGGKSMHGHNSTNTVKLPKVLRGTRMDPTARMERTLSHISEEGAGEEQDSFFLRDASGILARQLEQLESE